MARDNSGTKNEPQYTTTGAPADAADLTEIALYASTVGNRKVGPTTHATPSLGRTTSTGSDVWEGLLWGDTTDGWEYRYTSGAWVQWGKAKDGVKLIRTGTAGVFTGAAWTVLNTAGLWAVDQTAQGVTQTNGVVTVALAGMYDIGGAVLLGANVTAELIGKKNSVTADNSGMVCGGSGSGTNSFTVASFRAGVRLSAGDTIALAVLPSGAAQWDNSILAASFFDVRYREPLR